MLFELSGTAFITGAASGIGRGTALSCAQHGVSKLAILDTNIQMLNSTHDQLINRHPDIDVVPLEVDVTDETSVEAAIQKTAARFGRIDMVVNCAGIGGTPAATHETALSEWQRVIDINQTGVWICQKTVIQQMLKQESRGPRQGRGVIVNVSSMFGVSAPPAQFAIAPYTASKHAVMAITKSDAKAYGPKGIRINAICPGFVDTPIIAEGVQSGGLKPEFEKTPLGRAANVDEITDSILFLASPTSSFMCGAGLVVDGGYSI